MNKIKNLILMSFVVSITANADFKFSNFMEENSLYIGTSIGYTNINTNKDDKESSVLLTEKLSSNAFNLQFEIGKVYNNIESSFNYQRVESDEVDLDNLYFSVKYRFNENSFTPYLGGNIGYSQLSWNKSPVNTQSNDTNSSSFLLGLNTGILYPLNKNLDLNLNYQLNYTNHKAILESNLSKSHLYHNWFNSLNFGIRYSF